ncbi:MAG: glycosyltransferase [Pseudoalteromonas sp.]
MRENITILNAISASEGGALSVLKEKLLTIETTDKVICFTSIPNQLSSFTNVELIDVSHLRGAKRFYWDLIGLNNFLKEKYGGNKIRITLINFHNMSSFLPSFSDVRKKVIFHQAIAISNIKFSEYIRDRSLFFYNKVYPYFISFFDNKDVIYEVQREWVKEGLSERNNIPKKRIRVLIPKVNVNLVKDKTVQLNGDFIFPSLYYHYKNHLILIEAIALYKSLYPNDFFKIHITLDKYSYLHNKTVELGVEEYFLFIGYVDINIILDFYREGGSLLFPSKIESLGLPLLEARGMNSFVITSDLPYAKEALSDYSKVSFIDPNNKRDWALAINKLRRLL